MACRIWIILYTIVVHNQIVCDTFSQGKITSEIYFTVYNFLSRWHCSSSSFGLFTSCPSNNFLLPCPIWKIFYTLVVHDPKVCHELDLRSYLQGQGHIAHISTICVRVVATLIVKITLNVKIFTSRVND